LIGRAETAAVVALALAAALFISLDRTRPLPPVEKQAVDYAYVFGDAVARRIIAGRPYSSVDDLLRVEGIGEGKLAAIRGLVTAGG
jgi:hypothetical protein